MLYSQGRRGRTRLAAAGIGAAVVGGLLVPLPAVAAEGADVVINEAYLKAGSAGAFYANKFVELYNDGDVAQSLDGWSLQYRSATSAAAPSAGNTLPLRGTIDPGEYYLISLPGNNNGAVGQPLPAADATSSSLNPSGTTGTLFLADTTAPLGVPAGSSVGAAGVVDLLGYGGSNTFETALAVVDGPNGTPNALVRTDFADTDVNAADFANTTTVTPQSSTAGTTPAPQPTTGPSPSPAPSETGAPNPSPVPTSPPTPARVEIDEIQGPGDTTPLNNRTVTTRGVVTAAYPTGGFNGFYIQTPGTGGAIDLATHTASDGIFVYRNQAPVTVAVGDYVEVTGTATEYFGLTQLNAATGTVTELTESFAPVAPAAVAIPGDAAQREALESMLIAPAGDYTVSNTYSTNQYAEVGLAVGTTPLLTPTEVARPGTPAHAAAVADNAARAVTLDDAASINFLGEANKGIALPYLSDAQITVGAAVDFTAPLVLDYRNNAWKLQPTAQLVAGTPLPATFSNVRTAAPENVGGDIQLASFNVLNYFTTTAADVNCTSVYRDRAGNPITANSCGSTGPRGAADAANLARQEAKIVAAINALDAEVVSLEEIENSVKFGKDRDAALSTLVAALNADLGAEQWAYVPSPAAADLPPLAAQDVIRTAFIYKKAAAAPIGESVVLTDSTAFGNARQPLAQAFTTPDGDAAEFVAIVNHFKSKGDSDPKATGDNANGDQGAFNGDRVRQAEALVAFADRVADAAGTENVFLTGDFNAYTQEDPMHVFYRAGYTSLGSETGEYSYSFSGQSGSLDHILASAEASETVTGADIWNINAGEALALEYSRYNYNATDFYADGPYRSSDHDPIVVGIDLDPSVELNLLNINDFHGRIDANTVKFAGTVEQLRAQYGDDSSLLLSAGDNIGASLFASSYFDDEPTLAVLNALELAASAVGNHEFDKGADDLLGRVSTSADFPYLAANVYRDGEPILDEFALFERDGVTVAVIGAVTQETPSLVTPGGIAGLTFGDPVDAVNRVAAQIEAEGIADVIVAEYHEGSVDGVVEKATLEEEIAAGGAFAKIATQTAASVDVIFTGHTHKEYSWDGPVPGEAGTRPIVQTGSYGDKIGQVVLTLDAETREVEGYTAANVARIATPTYADDPARTASESAAKDAELIAAYPRVAAVATIVSETLAEAKVVGEQPVGSVTADITTSYANGSYVDGVYTGGTRDNRAGQSTLGNLVADALVSTLADEDRGGAEIGVVNAGGLRAELLYGADGVITYAEANAVLPFVNNLWTTTLTGAQFEEALEQQWQPDGASRPYLQLGLSNNVSYTFDATQPRGSRITGIQVDGAPIDPAREYRIGSFNFLLGGGDNFTALKGADTRDSGLVDRDAWIAYLQANPGLEPRYDSRSAQVQGVPATVARGQSVSLQVSGLDLTSQGSPANSTLLASIEGVDVVLDPIPVSGGAATVAFTVPDAAPASSTLVLNAPDSGTEIRVPLSVRTADLPGTGEPGTEVPGAPGSPQPPATTPVPAAVSQLIAALADKIQVVLGELVAGGRITISVGQQHAGTWVSVWLHSTPVQLGGWQQVAADGTVTVTLPDGVTGTHRLVVLDADGNVLGWQDVTIRAAGAGGALAVTGSGAGSMYGLVLAAMLLLAAGVAARMGVRRRQA